MEVTSLSVLNLIITGIPSILKKESSKRFV